MAADGTFALYRGIGAPLSAVTWIYALCFLGYGVGKDIFCDKDAFKELKMGQIAAAGAFCSVFTTPATAPSELAKCIMQTGAAPKEMGTWDVFKHTYTSNGGGFKGVKSCSKGLGATLLRDGLASAFYFTTYEYLKKVFTPEGEEAPGALGLLSAGGFAGILNWVAALPVDVMKTQFQVSAEGEFSGILLGSKTVFADIMKKDGPKGFYRGAVPVFTRAFPANAACFYGYEMAGNALDAMGLADY